MRVGGGGDVGQEEERGGRWYLCGWGHCYALYVNQWPFRNMTSTHTHTSSHTHQHISTYTHTHHKHISTLTRPHTHIIITLTHPHSPTHKNIECLPPSPAPACTPQAAMPKGRGPSSSGTGPEGQLDPSSSWGTTRQSPAEIAKRIAESNAGASTGMHTPSPSLPLTMVPPRAALYCCTAAPLFPELDPYPDATLQQPITFLCCFSSWPSGRLQLQQ